MTTKPRGGGGKGKDNTVITVLFLGKGLSGRTTKKKLFFAASLRKVEVYLKLIFEEKI